MLEICMYQHPINDNVLCDGANFMIHHMLKSGHLQTYTHFHSPNFAHFKQTSVNIRTYILQVWAYSPCIRKNFFGSKSSLGISSSFSQTSWSCSLLACIWETTDMDEAHSLEIPILHNTRILHTYCKYVCTYIHQGRVHAHQWTCVEGQSYANNRPATSINLSQLFIKLQRDHHVIYNVRTYVQYVARNFMRFYSPFLVFWLHSRHWNIEIFTVTNVATMFCWFRIETQLFHV